MIQSKYITILLVVSCFLLTAVNASAHKGRRQKQQGAAEHGCNLCRDDDYCRFNNLQPGDQYCDVFSKRAVNYGMGKQVGAQLLFGVLALPFMDMNASLFRDSLKNFFKYMHTTEDALRIVTMPYDGDLSGVYLNQKVPHTKISITKPPESKGVVKFFDIPATGRAKEVEYRLKTDKDEYRLFYVNNKRLIILDKDGGIRCAGQYTRRLNKHTSDVINHINVYCDHEFGSNIDTVLPLSKDKFINVTLVPEG